MYTEFLKGLAELAEKLDEVAKIGSDVTSGGGMPTPYVAGSLEVKLEGEVVGYFDFEDEYVIYREKPPVVREKLSATFTGSEQLGTPEALKTTVESPPEGLKTTVEKYDPTEEPFA